MITVIKLKKWWNKWIKNRYINTIGTVYCFWYHLQKNKNFVSQNAAQRKESQFFYDNKTNIQSKLKNLIIAYLSWSKVKVSYLKSRSSDCGFPFGHPFSWERRRSHWFVVCQLKFVYRKYYCILRKTLAIVCVVHVFAAMTILMIISVYQMIFYFDLCASRYCISYNLNVHCPAA